MVAVIAVRVVEVAIDQIIDMVAMRHRLVAAVGSVHVGAVVPVAVVFGSATLGRLRVHSDDMLIDVVAMKMMQMPIVQVIHVAVVFDCGVTAVRAVGVIVVRVLFTAHVISFEHSAVMGMDR